MDPGYPWLTPSFGVVGTGVAVLLGAYAFLVQPMLGRRRYQRLLRERPTDPTALVRFMRRAAVAQCTGAVLVALVLITSDGIDRRDLGLVWPTGRHLHTAVAWTAYALGVVVIGGVVLRRRAFAGRPVPGQQAVIALIPRTRQERYLAGVVAVGAGVAEELVFRGLFIAAGMDLLGVSVAAALLISSVVFAVAHVYQGVRPLPFILLIGLGFGWLYLASESLVLPMLVHVAMDLRGLVMVPAELPGARERAH